MMSFCMVFDIPLKRHSVDDAKCSASVVSTSANVCTSSTKLPIWAARGLIVSLEYLLLPHKVQRCNNESHCSVPLLQLALARWSGVTRDLYLAPLSVCNLGRPQRWLLRTVVLTVPPCLLLGLLWSDMFRSTGAAPPATQVILLRTLTLLSYSCFIITCLSRLLWCMWAPMTLRCSNQRNLKSILSASWTVFWTLTNNV